MKFFDNIFVEAQINWSYYSLDNPKLLLIFLKTNANPRS